MAETAEISFEEALPLSEALLLALEQNGLNDELSSKLKELLSSVPSCRGFFVSYLTGDCSLADAAPDYLIAAFAESEVVPDLLAKNLVMSCTMEITHRRKGDERNETGSKQVKNRTIDLIRKMQSPDVHTKLKEMRFSIRQKTGIYNDFIKRWNYDQEQLDTATSVIESLIG